MHPARLRKLLAEIIATEKSYVVPSICSAVGLADGTEEEAFSSKRQYALKRLADKSYPDLIDIATRLNSMIDSSELQSLVSETKSLIPSDEIHKNSLAILSLDHLNKRWERALDRRNQDPEGAITLARTLIEDVCKAILDEAKRPFSDRDDLPKLYRAVSEEMNLSPDQHTEQAFKQVFGSCTSIIQTIGTIRNKLGDAHSGLSTRSRPNERHATLVVNLAGTMASFLAETWNSRGKTPDK